MDKSQWKVTPRFIALLITPFAIWYLLMLLVTMRGNNHRAPNTKARVEGKSLNALLQQYRQAFGDYPTGENSNIVRILTGDNPKKRVFFHFLPLTQHPDEMLDPWKTPYQIEFLHQTNFVIRSAGRDKIFSNMDDIVFNSLSNDFMKP